MEANVGKSFQMQILFNIFPRISLHCKLVPVQYWEYEYDLLDLIGHFRNVRGLGRVWLFSVCLKN